MKKIILGWIVLLYFISAHSQGWRQDEMEVIVEIHSENDALLLHKLRLNGDFYGNYALMYVTPVELGLIHESGLEYKIRIANLEENYRHFWETDDAYHTYQGIINLADSLVLNFPAICIKNILGTSIGGRQLAALKISDNPGLDENEPEIMFDAGIHGDEIGGPENLIRFARKLCLEYGTNSQITDLVNAREIWLYLMVNPDGRVRMSRYNNNGIDLNRDCGYMWDAWGGSPGAFSQHESKVLRDITLANQFVIHTTYHSGTEMVSYPWSYRVNEAPDKPHIAHLAQVYSTNSGYTNLAFGQGYSGMYPINGSTKDGNYGIMGSVSWSIEISNNKQPPASQINEYFNKNVPAMLALINYAGQGIEGTIKNATTGGPVSATIFVNNFLSCCTDPVVGDFHKYVLPGIYNLTVKANGYADTTITGIMVSEISAAILEILLTPENHQHIFRVLSSQIPDNNPMDEGTTWLVIGRPDNQYYSIGKNGWIVVDMEQTITDKDGVDILVYEGDASQEGFTLFAGDSTDGLWHTMGFGTGTTGFDFSACTIQQARYFKIVDDGDGSTLVNDAGFDLDAIEAVINVSAPLNPPQNLTAQVQGNNVLLNWEAPSAKVLLSYNVYRNDSLIYQTLLSTEFTDQNLLPGNYEYAVTAIYSNGESLPTQPVAILIPEPLPTHFDVVWQTPFSPMTFYILSAKINNLDMQPDDEIGIFDIDPASGDEICVGAGILTEVLGGTNYLEITASMNDGTIPGQANGFTAGNPIIYKLWTEETGEISDVDANYPYPGYDEVFAALGTAFVELTGLWEITQTISLQNGWNLMSFRVQPDNWDMLAIVQPLINQGILYKVIDENGGSIFHLPFPQPDGQWSNTIGDMANTEGYYIKTTFDGELPLAGIPVELPFDVPLSHGWNMISYPCLLSQEALNVVQPLIDSEILYKVIDEEGGLVFHLPFPPPDGQWINTIGSFETGKGYYLKVLADTSLTFTEPETFSELGTKNPERRPNTYFNPVWENNPFMPMHIILQANYELSEGDEIGIFDGSICVGTGVFNGDINIPIVISCSMDDPDSGELDGFTDGNEITFKVWDIESQLLWTNPQIEFLAGESVFTHLETFAGNLISITTGTGQNLTDKFSIEIILNPVFAESEIDVSLPENGMLSLSVCDISGKTMLRIAGGYYDKGSFKNKINNQLFLPGFYLLKYEYFYDDKKLTGTLKLIIVK